MVKVFGRNPILWYSLGGYTAVMWMYVYVNAENIKAYFEELKLNFDKVIL